MRKTLLALAIAVAMAVPMTGCSALDVLKTATSIGGSSGPSVSAQVGEEANKQVIVGDQTKQEQDIEVSGEASEVEVTTDNRKVGTSFDGDVSTEKISVTNFPQPFIYFLVVVALAGWVLPTPMQLWRTRRGRFR